MGARQIVVDIVGNSDKFNESVNKAATSADGLGHKLNTGLKIASVAAFGGLTAIAKMGWDGIKEGADATDTFEDALTRSSKTMKAQKDALEDNSTALQKKTKFTQEDALAIDTVIAKNTALTNVVGQHKISAVALTNTIADMATVMKSDGATAAETLGKALAKPESASKALMGVGIVLTKAQQEQIKAWDKAGDKAKSQALILDLVKKKTEGAAEAMGNTMSGKIERAKNAFGEMTENLTGALLPAFTKLMDIGMKVSAWLQDNPAKVKLVAEVVRWFSCGSVGGQHSGKGMAGNYEGSHSRTSCVQCCYGYESRCPDHHCNRCPWCRSGIGLQEE